MEISRSRSINNMSNLDVFNWFSSIYCFSFKWTRLRGSWFIIVTVCLGLFGLIFISWIAWSISNFFRGYNIFLISSINLAIIIRGGSILPTSIIGSCSSSSLISITSSWTCIWISRSIHLGWRALTTSCCSCCNFFSCNSFCCIWSLSRLFSSNYSFCDCWSLALILRRISLRSFCIWILRRLAHRLAVSSSGCFCVCNLIYISIITIRNHIV